MPGFAITAAPDADHELARRVASSLTHHHVPSLRRLEVSAAGGVVTLRGRVHSFYEKQLSQHCCRHVPGVLRLIDAVEVSAEHSPLAQAAS